MIYFSALLVAILITISLMPVLVKVALRLGIVDVPDARKVHSVPIPRIGGVAIALGSFLPFLLWQEVSALIIAWFAGASLLIILGLLDDFRGLNYKIKFLGQIIAALIVIFYGDLRITNLGELLPAGMVISEWFSILLTLVTIIGVTNAINLSDGLDGLAGGICFLSLCCIAYLAFSTDQTLNLFASIVLAGAVFGFLRYNTHPATLFMGDAGSLFLGFSVITFSLAITQGSTPLSPVLPLIILGFPVLDTLTVMSERIASGRSPFVADKNHLHHRILRLGFHHTESVALIYVLQALLVTAAILFRYHSEKLLVGSYIVFSGLILLSFFVAEKIGWKVKRIDLVDQVIKGHLKKFADAGVLIKLFFRGIEYGLPVLLVTTCLIPAVIPGYFQLLSAVLVLLLIATWLFRKEGLQRTTLSLSLYLFIPYLLYLAATNTSPWMNELYQNIYSLFCLILLLLVFLTLRFSRRKKGFHVTPMDFLIVFLVLIAPLIFGTYIQYKELGLIVAMTIMLFFCYEVLMGELRGNLGRLALMTAASLFVVVVRGFL
jgi:UDP-GlcNAc:undecaprenyl-phosphate/decaprenyl-phosphate GlcNAc-1-phosphate transferase